MQELIDIIERGFDSGGKTANDDEAKKDDKKKKEGDEGAEGESAEAPKEDA